MRQFICAPVIDKFDSIDEFERSMNFGPRDAIITNRYVYSNTPGGAKAIYQEDFGAGEPTIEMAARIIEAVPQDCERVTGIGGGTVMDIAKIAALKKGDIGAIFHKQASPVKARKLALVPTTCGTGSEVTNVSVLAFPEENIKLGLADSALFADSAALVPEFLKNLPYRAFAHSSLDALIHALESYLSPRATPFTRAFSEKAIHMIIAAYKRIAAGEEIDYDSLLTASNFAGLAFGTAGCGAVHAMSYPFSGKYHVAHGEANYALFMGVLEYYPLERDLASFKALLNKILPAKRLSEYGVTRDDIPVFAKSVIEKQGRLLGNSMIPLTQADIEKIYERCM